MTSYEIDVQNEYGVADFPSERVIKAIQYVLDQHDVEDSTALSVVIMNDAQVREMNEQYRGINSTTDILSFAADPLPDEIEGEAPYLGDLIIAYPYTLHQAQEAGHNIEDELVFLVIHGTLHLLGYDHDNTEHQAEMWAEQADALKSQGVTLEVPHFTFGDDLAD